MYTLRKQKETKEKGRNKTKPCMPCLESIDGEAVPYHFAEGTRALARVLLSLIVFLVRRMGIVALGTLTLYQSEAME